jgi:BirA family biotin operon repressor/biotin-[acetyl-CoA-carboxylase] ligase
MRASVDGPLSEWPRRFGVSCALRLVAQTRSTQDEARRLIGTGAPDGLTVLACRQTAGRGRLGRVWHDSRGDGVAMTMIRRRPLDRDAAAALPLACGLAVIDALQTILGRRCPALGLKWPNDIMLVDGQRRASRKLGGVLVEHVGGAYLMGIGINVHQGVSQFPASLRGLATSLRMLGRRVSRPRLAGAVAGALVERMREDSAKIASDWQRVDALKGCVCEFESTGVHYSGRVVSIEPLSRIVLDTGDSNVKYLDAAVTTRIA